jgi:single-strand DNA-binding protein
MLLLIASGNLVRDCKITALTNNSNRSVINFTLAINSQYKDKQGQIQKKVTYLDCALWRDNEYLKVAELLKKGNKIIIHGEEVEARTYKNGEGNEVASIKVSVSYIEPCGYAPKQEGGGNSEQQNSGGSSGKDDLPF